MKIKRNKTNQKGFTLIEVVLVLAIGGLIFLLAFLAFQQVSVNRRDTQRRSDAGRLISEIQNYYGDKNAYPAASPASYGANLCASGGAAGSFQDFAWNYLCGKAADGFVSPQANYTSTNATPTTDQIRFTVGDNCDGTGTGNKVEIGLEKGVTCRDDQ